MKKAIDETERRRAKQHQFNLDNGITPKGVIKKITDVMDVGGSTVKQLEKQVAEKEQAYHVMSVAEIDQQVKVLEAEMFKHAQDLEFEQAAAVRDKIAQLRQQQLSV